MKKIAIDAMGGDHAPVAIVKGVNQALKAFSDIEIVLYGDKSQIEQTLIPNERATIVATTEKILSEDDPVRSIRKKKDASMVVAARDVKEGKVDAVISAGNTGALLASGVFIAGRIPGIDRPGLMSTLPTIDGIGVDMMDLGANAENTPHHLHQYAILGSFYAKHVRGIANPRVGLLNNGTETSKGDSIRKETYALLDQDTSIHFVGNIEARELLNGVADVVVTDGFTGNAVLKTIEGTALTIGRSLKDSIQTGGIFPKIGYLFMKKSFGKLRRIFDPSEAGGAVLFGIQVPMVKVHGSSQPGDVFKGIRQVRTMLDSRIIPKSVAYFSQEEKHD